MMFLGAIVGRVIAKTRGRGVRGAVWGLRLSLVAIVAMTVHLSYTGWNIAPRPKTQPYDVSHRQPVEKLLKTVKGIVPSVQGIPNDSKLKQTLAGMYENDFTGLAGEFLYLFPDGTYLCVEWADILLPGRLCDRGQWECNDGLLPLHSDGDLVATFSEDMDTIYLPMTTVAEEKFVPRPVKVGESCTILFGVDRGIRFLQEEVKSGGPFHSRNYAPSPFGACSCWKSESISLEGTAKIKTMLYKTFPTDFDRAVWRDKLLKHGMAIGLIAVVLALVRLGGLRQGRRPKRAPAGSFAQEVPHNPPALVEYQR